MRWILLFICVSNVWATEVTVDPEWRTVPEEIQEIANLEMEIEGKLRDDRVDKMVQFDIQESIDRMEKLIKDAEEIEETSKESRRKHDLLVMKGARQPNNPGRKPSAAGDTTDPKQHIVYEKSDAGEWARLPRSERNEITQVWAADIPILWKRRLEAYFRSVNADDTEKLKK